MNDGVLPALPHLELPLQAAGGVWADPNREGTRLDRFAHVQVDEAEFTHRYRKAHGLLFYRLERDALEAYQLFDGAGHAAHHVAHIELRRLGTGAQGGVLHDRRHHQHIVMSERGRIRRDNGAS